MWSEVKGLMSNVVVESLNYCPLQDLTGFENLSGLTCKAILLSVALQLFESSKGAERNKHLSDRAMHIKQKNKNNMPMVEMSPVNSPQTSPQPSPKGEGARSVREI